MRRHKLFDDGLLMPATPAIGRDLAIGAGSFKRAFRSGDRIISGTVLPAAWNQYNTQDPNGFELAHYQAWFDRTYTSATTTVLNFFDQPLNTDDLFTNVFPYQNSILVKAIGLFFKFNFRSETIVAPPAIQTGVINDATLLTNTGVLTITLGKKQWGPFSLAKLSPGCGIFPFHASGAVTANYEYAQLGMPTVEAAFRLSVPFVIPANTAARVQMAWPAGAVTLTAGNPSLRLFLETVEARPRQ